MNLVQSAQGDSLDSSEPPLNMPAFAPQPNQI